MKGKPLETAFLKDKTVFKDHPRIKLRGQLDSLLALIDYVDAELAGRDACLYGIHCEVGCWSELVSRLMYMDATDEVVGAVTEWIKMHEGTRDDIKFGVYPTNRYSHLLNLIRTKVREAELAAASATPLREPIFTIQAALNLLSIVVYETMCVANEAVESNKKAFPTRPLKLDIDAGIATVLLDYERKSGLDRNTMVNRALLGYFWKDIMAPEGDSNG